MLLERRQAQIADQIFNEFDRLGISTNQDPYSGLKTDAPNCFDYHNPDMLLVRVYDDLADGIYDAEKLFNALQKAQPGQFSLNSDADNNIWDYLVPYEV